MDFTKSFIKSKNPCMDGYRWYLRHHRDGSDYQQVLDELVAAGRIQDACWLLEKLGPTSAVLRLDQLECDSLVFAGTVEVRGAIDVDSVLRAGGSIVCGGHLRAGEELRAGGDIKSTGGMHCDGDVWCAGLLAADWHSHAGGQIAADQVKVRGSLSCGGHLSVAGAASVQGDVVVGGNCTARSLSVRRNLQATGQLRLQQGLICGQHVHCGGPVEAGSGIKAGGDIVAGASILVGESIEALGEVRAGNGYGVFAGLGVQRCDWDTSARVRAGAKPVDLMSGFWVEENTAPQTRPDPGGATEVRHAH